MGGELKMTKFFFVLKWSVQSLSGVECMIVSCSPHVTDTGDAGHRGCSTGHTNARLLLLRAIQ